MFKARGVPLICKATGDSAHTRARNWSLQCAAKSPKLHSHASQSCAEKLKTPIGSARRITSHFTTFQDASCVSYSVHLHVSSSLCSIRHSPCRLFQFLDGPPTFKLDQCSCLVLFLRVHVCHTPKYASYHLWINFGPHLLTGTSDSSKFCKLRYSISGVI